jgi:hypothetical protein
MATADRPDRERARELFARYRKNRQGIRRCPEMASVCLICGSVHIVAKGDDEYTRVCRNCGFPFLRYACPACGEMVDGRDPENPGCGECGLRLCICGACACPVGNAART